MKRPIIAALAMLSLAVGAFAAADAGLLRFPNINGDRVVFVYAGDIWSVPAAGGDARRLTSHPGLELFPKISPDGKWIAFSAEYSGSRQVWVMPAAGGEPRQLTWYNDVGVMPPRGGYDYVVLDWTPDSRRILVRCNRTPWGERMGKYFLVPLDGGLEAPLAIPEAGGGSFSPDAARIVYTPIEREFRTWKRTLGGRAQDIWIYDLAANSSRRLTDFPGTDQHPSWWRDRIYFVSDRDRTLNVYSCDLQGGTVTQLTRHQDYDVLWPSGRDGRLAYECGGRLHVLDLASGQERRLAVNLNFDNANVLPYFRNVAEFIGSYDLSPSGKRAVFDARGDLFTVPEKEGRTVNLTRSQGVREIFPAWSPDGSRIAYYSDASGEYEVYVMDANGAGAPRQLTRGSRGWRFPPKWSPDGRMLLFADRDQALRLLDVASGAVTVVDRARRHDLTDYDWSPDSRWLVYSKDGDSGQDAVWVYSLDRQQAFQLTDAAYNDFSPVFSRDGRYIYFLSNRDFNLEFSDFEFDYLYNRATRIYALALTRGTAPLFPERNDVEEGKAPAAGSPEAKKPAAPAAAAAVRIDVDGCGSRVTAFPLPSGAYAALRAVDGGILYFRERELRQFKLEDKKDGLVIAGIDSAVLAAGGAKVLYQARNQFGVVGLGADQKAGDGALDLSQLTLRIEPRREWAQIFRDGWRIFRDWFYQKNLHGVDWEKTYEKYARLLPSLSHRADLDFLFGEMVGEVNAGHTYVNWGDFPRPARVEGGLLGAELRADEKAGRYRVARIYAGENWNEDTRSPLTEPGVDVRPGDLLLALNGCEVTLADNPYRFLENTAGRRVAIRVGGRSDGAGAREYWITPVKSELGLMYLDWVRSRREMVDRLSGGRIGYIHVPDTSRAGNAELFKGMYAYGRKEALIIDDRYNGGGFIPVVMAELLARKTLNYWARRGLGLNPDPGVAHDGPKAMLINGYSSSGGDAFPYYFRKKKLGVLIGTRTWGGLIGLSGNPDFADGGSLNVPTFGFVDDEGAWAVEGRGVAPDIEVIDRPEQVAAGGDPSIEKAVAVLLEQLQQNPPRRVDMPAEPDRSQWIEKDSRGTES
ncbi:MAG TPA: PDZ domain-containing protein [Candidatus Aminicenantes bacterium]|nr:PDZ domain-containing protein [Candidatus Aminicenantes bacterium]